MRPPVSAHQRSLLISEDHYLRLLSRAQIEGKTPEALLEEVFASIPAPSSQPASEPDLSAEEPAPRHTSNDLHSEEPAPRRVACVRGHTPGGCPSPFRWRGVMRCGCSKAS